MKWLDESISMFVVLVIVGGSLSVEGVITLMYCELYCCKVKINKKWIVMKLIMVLSDSECSLPSGEAVVPLMVIHSVCMQYRKLGSYRP